jgi:pimeloyl-ACP methyl ester carboxylesterase
VARLLVNALPQVEVVEFGTLGHMGPVTHPDVVNEAIGRFLERTHIGSTVDGASCRAA